ncbi:MAG: sulfurtransferase FdhD, partial [Deinococcus-Thermus bacterium]|nr:sulfurtransferase FdhD [Deinococcota bacterium]
MTMEIRHITDPARPVSPRARGTLTGTGGTRPADWAVPEETPLAVLVNGQSFAVMMGTPADLEDFAVGFALTEGLVDRADRIAGLSLSAGHDGVLVNLRIDPALAERAAERARSLPGRSGCGVCGAQTIEAALPAPPR